MHRATGKQDLLEKELTGSIIGAFYYVYNQLGYGFLERIYAEAMRRTLEKLGHRVQREVSVPVYLEQDVIGIQRVDMLVDSKVIVENKSTFLLDDADHRQLTSYLTSTDIQVGLLLHFGPEPRFYRKVCTRSPRRNVADPSVEPALLGVIRGAL